MKKSIAILLCAALTLSFAACGNKSKTQGGAERTLYTTQEPTSAAATTIPMAAYPTVPAGIAPTTAAATTAAATTTDAATTLPVISGTAAQTTAATTVPTLTAAPTVTAAPPATTLPATTVPPTTAAPQKKTACTILIDCKNALSDPSLSSVLPAGGVILAATTEEIEEGESVFDVLQRVCRENGIPMEFSMVPMYSTAYIEGIGNLYEFDGGSMSGWMYCVNGEYPNFGCSKYRLKDGDRIEWHYTMDLGEDLGAKDVEQR